MMISVKILLPCDNQGFSCLVFHALHFYVIVFHLSCAAIADQKMITKLKGFRDRKPGQ